MDFGRRALARTALLVVAIACGGAAGADGDRTVLQVGGTGAALGTMRQLGEAYAREYPGMQVHVLPYIGSTGAIKGVVEGVIHVGLSARPLGSDEQAKPVRLIPYALTPLIFIAHPDAPVAGVSRQEVAAMYAGRRRNWDDGSPIRLVLRPRRETDNAVLRAWAPEMADALETAFARRGMRIAPTDHDSARDVERTPGAFGTSTLALALSERRRFKVLALDGVMPSLRSLEDQSYAPVKRLYLVVANDAPPAARAFVDFVLSPAGARMLRANGQLPIARGDAR